jgi:hypothetical protein
MIMIVAANTVRIERFIITSFDNLHIRPTPRFNGGAAAPSAANGC